MSNLVDMKCTTEEKMAGQEAMEVGGQQEDYPYGLTITLSNKTMEKLGIPLPEVGKEVNIAATAKVIEASERSVDGGEADRRVELQITEMAISKPVREVDADKLYPTMSADSATRSEV